MAWSYCTNPGCRVLVPEGGRCPRCASRQNAERRALESWRHVPGRSGVQDIYHSPRWRALRRQVLIEAKYLCECDACALRPCPLPANTVDHKQPHNGDDTLRWDRANLQAMARECHTRKTIAERGTMKRIGQTK